jgi:hypothetical protein
MASETRSISPNHATFLFMLSLSKQDIDLGNSPSQSDTAHSFLMGDWHSLKETPYTGEMTAKAIILAIRNTLVTGRRCSLQTDSLFFDGSVLMVDTKRSP